MLGQLLTLGSASGSAQVDFPEQQGQLGGLELQALAAGFGEFERSLFKPLVPEAETPSIPEQDLDPVPPLVVVAAEGRCSRQDAYPRLS